MGPTQMYTMQSNNCDVIYLLYLCATVLINPCFMSQVNMNHLLTIAIIIRSNSTNHHYLHLAVIGKRKQNSVRYGTCLHLESLTLTQSELKNLNTV